MYIVCKCCVAEKARVVNKPKKRRVDLIEKEKREWEAGNKWLQEQERNQSIKVEMVKKSKDVTVEAFESCDECEDNEKPKSQPKKIVQKKVNRVSGPAKNPHRHRCSDCKDKDQKAMTTSYRTPRTKLMSEYADNKEMAQTQQVMIQKTIEPTVEPELDIETAQVVEIIDGYTPEYLDETPEPGPREHYDIKGDIDMDQKTNTSRGHRSHQGGFSQASFARELDEHLLNNQKSDKIGGRHMSVAESNEVRRQ